MKKLLSTTTALSLALVPVQPWPLFAQSAEAQAVLADDGSILAADGTVLCLPTADVPCNPLDFGILAIPGLEVAVEEPSGSEATVQSPEAVTEPAPAETAVLPAVDPVSEETATTNPDTTAEPSEGGLAEALAKQGIEAKDGEENGQGKKNKKKKTEAILGNPEPASTAPETSVQAPEVTLDTSDQPLGKAIEEAFKKAKEAEAATTAVAPVVEAIPVEVPEVSAEAAASIEQLLSGTSPSLGDVIGAIAAQPATDGTGDTSATQPAPEPQAVTETTITESDTRSSFEEFAKAPKVLEGGRKKSGLSDLEKAGLIALGAIVVGKMLSDGREVVSNSGDRVVVREPDGGYQVYKDDDTLLRRPGSTVRTETYGDGSTRSTVTREDGSEVVTIRDATGRVLRRVLYDTRGNETVLIDDLMPEEQIDVSVLPEPRPERMTISSRGEDASLRAELARVEAQRLGRSFSLRQIRDIKEVRRLAAVIDVDNITFDTGSAVIRTTEARKLADLGGTMSDILDNNPYEVFLIEGHTDAVGSASSNLALSDRRAESVALALTEYFGIPPENMVVQGYGEYDLRVETDADERRNRRVAVRLISPLMETASR